MVHCVLILCCQSKRDLHRNNVISFTDDGRETFLMHKILFHLKGGESEGKFT